jgi:hypothetical protein
MESTLQGIFISGFDTYKKRHGLSTDQYKAAEAIMHCQREELGYEQWECFHDGHTEQQNHSCRHRSCPRCHGAQSHEWLENIKQRLLPCDHYHVIFTLPHELNELWQYNRSWSSDHLFRASAETLKQLLADDKYLGAEVGMLSALHTWGRTLSFHPHVHVLVSGGGLSGEKWKRVKKDFLLPVAVIKAKFRGKWLSWLNAAYEAGELTLPPQWTTYEWKKVLREIARKQWNVRIQNGYPHGSGVATYLSRYMRGGPIKDHRIISAQENSVSFRYRDHRDHRVKTLRLSAEHFMSRVLWHVPVKGQHGVRYYGLYTAAARGKRNSARDALGYRQETQATSTEKPPRECPHCGRPLFHRSSVRRQISSIRNSAAIKRRRHADPVQSGNRGYLTPSPHTT